jgi:uncharacterized protein YegL
MTRRDLTRIYFLLDRSGSMQSIKTATEAGFAGFIRDQEQAPGACRVTLAQFDHSYEVVYSDVPVAEVPPLTLAPRGSTALLDAMGTLITDAGAELAELPENERPGTVIVAIMTDGKENSSNEWNHPGIKALVEQQTGEYSWQFLYMGADQDAIEVGSSLGVNAEHSVSYGRDNTAELLATTSGKVRSYRKARMNDPDAVMVGYTAEERSSLLP